MIHFDLPKEQSSIIKVIGVGGGGSNAVNHMFAQNIEGVNFIICNTDAQAIAQSKVPNKIQLGPHLTQGLGAGANPSIGRQATEESLEEIKRILEVNTKMAFITAGMGGGTGTGGAPILAKICKDLGILTVGIVTTPFAYEGKKRIAQAEEGIGFLKDHVDTLLVISNDKLRHQFGNLKMREAFEKADNVLATAAKCITDVINSTGQINTDFADVCTVMRNGGVAILGSATASGENRAQIAIENALNSPLLNDNDIHGAKWILININSAEGEHEFTMDEVEIIQNHLLANAGEESDVILGLGYDNTLGNEIGITLIATGFEHKDPFEKKPVITDENDSNAKIIFTLETPEIEVKDTPKPINVSQPTFVFDTTTESENNVTENRIQEDELMPKLIENNEPNTIEINAPKLSEEELTKPIFYEISSSIDQSPAIEFDIPMAIPVPEKLKEISSNLNIIKSDKNSNSTLTKPTKLYVTEKTDEIVKNNDSEKLMQLIEKPIDLISENNEIQTNITFPNQDLPVPTIENETEEFKLKASERLKKLRNLSFNTNISDPNNEFETIPAFMRRNSEMQNSIADVENFYSNYTVKSNENNQAEISTINTFLEGKKPD